MISVCFTFYFLFFHNVQLGSLFLLADYNLVTFSTCDSMLMSHTTLRIQTLLVLVSNNSCDNGPDIFKLPAHCAVAFCNDFSCVYYRALDEVHCNEVHCNTVHLHL